MQPHGSSASPPRRSRDVVISPTVPIPVGPNSSTATITKVLTSQSTSSSLSSSSLTSSYSPYNDSTTTASPVTPVTSEPPSPTGSSSNLLSKMSRIVPRFGSPELIAKNPFFSTSTFSLDHFPSTSTVIQRTRKRALSVSSAPDDWFAGEPVTGPVSVRRNSGMSRSSDECLKGTGENSLPDSKIETAVGSSRLGCPYPGVPVTITYTERSDCNTNNSGSNITGYIDSGITTDSAIPASTSTIPGANASDTALAPRMNVPASLMTGVVFLRITHRKKVQRTFTLDPENGVVKWDDRKSWSKFHIDRVHEVYVGADARNYREEFKVSAEHEPRWASIVYSRPDSQNKLKSLHIVAASQGQFDLFIDTVRQLVRYRRQLMSGLLALSGDRFVSVHWNRYVTRADTGEERLSFESVEKLARGLHINCSRSYLESQFRAADVDCSGYLDFEEFKNFVHRLKWRPDIANIFMDIADVYRENHRTNAGLSLSSSCSSSTEGRYLSFTGLSSFIRTVQNQLDDDETISKMYTKFAISTPHDGLTCSEFVELLTSYYFPAVQKSGYSSSSSSNAGALTLPLSEYFISSSHNTYLLGRQVAGPASLEAYVRVLQNGCRCVEIDCWDGDSGPIVCHGRRLTTSLAFADVVRTIRKCAFIASPYPLILSLEVHCNSENQLRMVEILKSVFGEQLLTQPLMSNYLTLPSPEELKHKVLIKVKRNQLSVSSRPGLFNVAAPAVTGFSSLSSLSSSLSSSFSSSLSSSFSSSPQSTTQSSSTSPSTSSSSLSKRRSSTKIIDELSVLGVYFSGVKLTNFSLPISKTPNHVFSLSERRVNAIVKDPVKRLQLEKHNAKYLMRVYPSGYRVSSSNFDPVAYWKRGAQMVALNWQTNDIALQLNTAFFGSSDGYVAKPPALQASSRLTKFRSILTNRPNGNESQQRMYRVSIKVISAQQLPRPKDLRADEGLNPKVCVEIYGISQNESCEGSFFRFKKHAKDANNRPIPSIRWRTPAVLNNGFNPQWNCEWSTDISESDFPFVFIRLAVVHGDDSTFAVQTVRLSCLNQGYRHLQLQDLQGEEYIFSTLFIRTSVQPL